MSSVQDPDERVAWESTDGKTRARFKDFMEKRGAETGGRRGNVEAGS